MRSVTPQHKPFDQSLHDLHDDAGKRRVSRWLTIWDRCEVSYGEQYGVDLIAHRDGKIYAYIEVEQRNWGGRCSFDTIHVAYRKKKFFDPKVMTFLFAIDIEGDWGYFCEFVTILASPLKKSPNKFMKDDEYFYDVPTKAFVEFEVNAVPYWYKGNL